MPTGITIVCHSGPGLINPGTIMVLVLRSQIR